ncbi:MAG TPA: hypothetical protein VI072_33925 [Polyangiaceae bacterium]
MKHALLSVGVWLGSLCLVLTSVACVEESGEEVSATGRLELPLTAQSSSGAQYRLIRGTFKVTGRAKRTLSSDAQPDRPTLSVDLPKGEYRIQLLGGWSLERRTTDGRFEPVEATLTSVNPVAFVILAQQSTRVTFRFKVGDDVVEFGKGRLNVDIEVDDCQPDGGDACAPNDGGGPIGPFSAISHFGAAENYTYSNPNRWVVASDQADDRLLLSATHYEPLSGGRLGEYALVRGKSYGDLMLRFRARSNENFAANSSADVAAVFGFQNENYYNYVLWSASAGQTQLFEVSAGTRRLIATASGPGLPDSAYHDFELWRHGSWVLVRIDNAELISAVDTSLAAVGAVGVGSYDDSAYFDDIDVTHYERLDTPNYEITLPSTYTAYADTISSLLENAYALHVVNTGHDVNSRFGHAWYEYGYRPSGWYWGNDPRSIALGGGLTVSGGPSVVLSDLIPESRLAFDQRNVVVAITLHELGNGWALPGPGMPAWLSSEDHSGFLRAAAELGLGYCVDAQIEHSAHYSTWIGSSPADRRDRGSGTEILLVSLQARYGPGLMRALYSAVQDGSLGYLEALGAEERDRELVVFLSLRAGENLAPFFERELGIVLDSARRTQLHGLPVAAVSILTTLECPAPTLRYTPSGLTLRAAPNQSASTALYVAAPVSWTARVKPEVDWLTLTRTSEFSITTLTARASATGLPLGTVRAATIEIESTGAVNPVVQVPVTLTVAEADSPVWSSGFENVVEDRIADWSTAFGCMCSDCCSPTFDADPVVRRSGAYSGRIRAGYDRPADAFFFQEAIAIEPHTKYVLSGFIKTENVVNREAQQTAAHIDVAGEFFSRSVAATSLAWVPVRVGFDSQSRTQISIQARLGYYGNVCSGAVWFDDLKLEKRVVDGQ